MGGQTQHMYAKAGYVHEAIMKSLSYAQSTGFEFPQHVLVVDKEWMYAGLIKGSGGHVHIDSLGVSPVERSTPLSDIVDNFPAHKLALIPSSDARIREAKGIGMVFGRADHYLGMMRGSKQVDVYNVPGPERARTRYFEAPKRLSYTKLGLMAAAVLTAALSVGALAYVLSNSENKADVAKPVTELKK